MIVMLGFTLLLECFKGLGRARLSRDLCHSLTPYFVRIQGIPFVWLLLTQFTFRRTILSALYLNTHSLLTDKKHYCNCFTKCHDSHSVSVYKINGKFFGRWNGACVTPLLLLFMTSGQFSTILGANHLTCTNTNASFSKQNVKALNFL